MTVAEAIESLPLKGYWKSLIRTGLRASKPGILDRRVVLRIDREAGTVALGVEGEPLVEMTFDEVEAHVASAECG